MTLPDTASVSRDHVVLRQHRYSREANKPDAFLSCLLLRSETRFARIQNEAHAHKVAADKDCRKQDVTGGSGRMDMQHSASRVVLECKWLSFLSGGHVMLDAVRHVEDAVEDILSTCTTPITIVVSRQTNLDSVLQCLKQRWKHV